VEEMAGGMESYPKCETANLKNGSCRYRRVTGRKSGRLARPITAEQLCRNGQNDSD